MVKADDDDGPVVVCIKVVPRIASEATGTWRKVLVDRKSKLRDRAKGGDTMWDYLATLAGEGNFAAALQMDLRFDGKPGDWHPK